MPAVPDKPVLEAPRTVQAKSEPNPFIRLVKMLGPGLIAGASDDDPSGIATYSQAGAQLGFTTLWFALVTFPLMAAVQYICAKIGLVTGKSLGVVLRKHYPSWVFYTAVGFLLIANTINVGADLGAIAAAINLIIPGIPREVAVVPITLILMMLLVFTSYQRIVNIFKWLTLSLFAYVATAFLVHPNWNEVLKQTFLPTVDFSSDSIAVYVAILGTTISPYLFFWQAWSEVEEQKLAGRKLWQRTGASTDDLKYCAGDVNTGMFFSNLVMYFIILATGATLYRHGHHNIRSISEAASALRPFAGPYAEFLFAAGLIGTGILAVPILAASSAQALAAALGWRRGLDEQWYRAKEFYAVIIIACLIGMGISLSKISPIDALFWTAVLNGILAPLFLVMIMLISNNEHVMGNKTNTTFLNILGWMATIFMFAAAAALAFISILKIGR